MADLGAGKAMGGILDEARMRIARRMNEAQQRTSAKVDHLLEEVDRGEAMVHKAIDAEIYAFNETVQELLGNTAAMTDAAIADAKRMDEERARLAAAKKGGTN